MTPLMEFTEIAEEWGPFFRSRARIALAVRNGLGEWHLFYGLTYFSPEMPQQYVPLDLETKSICAIRQVTALQPDSTPSLLFTKPSEIPAPLPSRKVSPHSHPTPAAYISISRGCTSLHGPDQSECPR